MVCNKLVMTIPRRLQTTLKSENVSQDGYSKITTSTDNKRSYNYEKGFIVSMQDEQD